MNSTFDGGEFLFPFIKQIAHSVLITDINLDTPGPAIVYVNPAFEMMTGWAKTEVLGKSPRILQGPKTDLGIFADLKERLRSEEIWEGQKVHLRQLIQAPGIRLWWSQRRYFFSRRFQNYIDELAALGSEMPTPAEVVRQVRGRQTQ